MDKRYLQANKEARLSLYTTLLYLICWITSAYCLSDKPGMLGLPAWFELSCVLTPIGFILICCLVVKCRFKDISLDNEQSTQSINK